MNEQKSRYLWKNLMVSRTRRLTCMLDKLLLVICIVATNKDKTRRKVLRLKNDTKKMKTRPQTRAAKGALSQIFPHFEQVVTFLGAGFEIQ